MKILLIQAVDYLTNRGGAYKANRILLEGLAARNHNCRVLTTFHPRKPDEYLCDLVARGIEVVSSTSGWTTYRHNGVEVLVARDRMQLYMGIVASIERFEPIWTLLETPDSLAIEAALVANPSRVVYLCHTATNLPFGPDCITPDPLKAKVLAKVGNSLTVSRYMKEYLKRWGGLDAKSLYWPSYGTGPFPHYGSFEAGYVTLVNPCAAKGQPILLELARRLPHVQFAAVPTWGTTDEDRAALAELSNICILEPQDDVNKIFAQTRVLLAPSLGVESFGQIVVEAMARGIPVLASDLGGLREAKLGVDYLLPVRQLTYHEPAPLEYIEIVPQQDVTPWQESLEELLADRARYERVAVESRQAALSFIDSLGIAPFEEYLANLIPAAQGNVTERSEEEIEKARKLEEQLKSISPAKRALLALRLANKNRGDELTG
jgi:glycosyltransferase involved in cell wall biosynthesis